VDVRFMTRARPNKTLISLLLYITDVRFFHLSFGLSIYYWLGILLRKRSDLYDGLSLVIPSQPRFWWFDWVQEF